MLDYFVDQAHGRFDYIQPEEALRNFESSHITLGTTSDGLTRLGLLSFPDLDRKPIFVPRVFTGDEDYLIEPMENAGAVVERRSLKSNERDKLIFFSEVLKLPILLCAQGINTGINLDQFKIPPRESESTKFLFVQGGAGVGKSTFLATMGLRYNLPIISLDTFSGKTPQAYLNFFRQKAFDFQTEDVKLIKAVEEFRKIEESKLELAKITPTQPLSSYLDSVLLDKFISDRRPPVMLVEGIGSRGAGIMSSNAYHLASGAGEYSYNLARHNSLEESTLNFKGNIMFWARTEGDYIQREFLRLLKQ